MTDHHELISEMPSVERMATQDRLKHAKKRRNQQLKKYTQYEKHLDKENSKKRKSGQSPADSRHKRNKRKVIFVPNISLLEAAARNDVEEVRHLLEKGVKPDLTNDDGLTAIHQCCIDDSEQMLMLLLEYGANVNSQDSEHWTPLHAAATCGHAHLCHHLIERGADLLAVNADGNMPYDICEDEATLDYIESEMAKRGITQEQIDDKRLASEKYVLEDLEKLKAANNSLEFVDHIGATPLHIAAANGYIDVAQFLLNDHVDVNKRDNDSWQPIHAAAYWGQPDLVDLLVQNGADIDAKTKNGETPFDLCEDPELKQKILDVKDEIETNRASKGGKSSLIKHRISSRSASMRRSSLRGDKGRLSLKEAKEEALHFGLRLLQDEEDLKEVDEEKENVPATNIDDVEIILQVEEDPQHNLARGSKPLTSQNEQMKQVKSKEVTKPSASKIDTNTQHSSLQLAQKQTKSQTEVKPVKPAPTPTPQQQPKQPLPAKQPQATAPSSTTQQTSKPTPENHSKPAQNIPIKPTPSVSDNANRPPADSKVNIAGRQPPPPRPQSTNSGSTLNDIKKQRSGNRQDILDAQVQSMFVERANNNWHSPYSSSNVKTSNGHNNNNTYPQETMKRFVAPSNVAIVGEEEKQHCCVVM